ncbi:uncharacterized protein LOC106152421 [Lingula anatina]|uniref:Uncharacterized protein LOC106152421 n=1 Tax=Lingula anatina TaxID=7574 RepID=A0A1S3H610_LINAN|nr:uncharacterized protein LOC106152421 [Lingula anatina]|eukprot:XP_013381438.1 uncharacterized protein LOC106152421 [Lingula anatina]
MSQCKPVEKAGYLDVKQPAKGRGIRIKAWKRKWLVLHQMSDLSAGKFLARLEIFQDEEGSRKRQADKLTMYLENVCSIQRIKSKSHSYAFEIQEDESVLCLAGESETEAQGWISALRKIFWPVTINPYAVLAIPEIFEVSLIENSDAQRLSLSGHYFLTVTPLSVALHSPKDGSTIQTWKLACLKRFYMPNKCHPEDFNKILVIQAGENSATGIGEFHLFTPEAQSLLQTIFSNVNTAIQQKRMGQLRPRTDTDPDSLGHFTTLLSNSQLPSQDSPPLSRSIIQRSSTSSSISDVPPPTPPRPKKLTFSTDRNSAHVVSSPVSRSPPRPSFQISPEGQSPSTNSVTSPPFRVGECDVSDDEDDDYHRLDFKDKPKNSGPPTPPRRQTFSQNGNPSPVPMLQHSKSDCGLEFNDVADDGYSHINRQKTDSPRALVSSSDKLRAMSTGSAVSQSSNSSKDSGLSGLRTQISSGDTDAETRKDSNCSSGDSAFGSVSASNAMDNLGTDLSRKTDLHRKISVASGIYHSIDDNDTDDTVFRGDDGQRGNDSNVLNVEPQNIPTSVNEDEEEENVYEELDRYKKDIYKYLGITDAPSSGPLTPPPPALPERTKSTPNSPDPGSVSKGTRRKKRWNPAKKLVKRLSKTDDKLTDESTSSDEEGFRTLVNQSDERAFPVQYGRSLSHMTDNTLYAAVSKTAPVHVRSRSNPVALETIPSENATPSESSNVTPCASSAKLSSSANSSGDLLIDFSEPGESVPTSSASVAPPFSGLDWGWSSSIPQFQTPSPALDPRDPFDSSWVSENNDSFSSFDANWADFSNAGFKAAGKTSGATTQWLSAPNAFNSTSVLTESVSAITSQLTYSTTTNWVAFPEIESEAKETGSKLAAEMIGEDHYMDMSKKNAIYVDMKSVPSSELLKFDEQLY